MKFTSAITFLSLSACISPTFGKKMKGKGKADEIPSSLCVSDIQCGQSFTGEVKLTEDLFCPSGDYASGDCAITLEGEDAVLDCNKYMINNNLGALDNGICILNGATANNCHVKKFGVSGIHVQNGGEVKDCEVMFNDGSGIYVEHEASSTSKMKISNTYIHDNGNSGISFYGYGDSPESSETSIEIANVKSNHNGGTGMRFNGENVKLEVKVTDSEASNNSYDGIYIIEVPKSIAAVDVELDGIISRYNEGNGVILSRFNTAGGEVKVKGDVNLYKNEKSGFIVRSDLVKVVVEKQGALNSCGHRASGSSDADIGSGADITFSGNGYTCNSTSPNLSNIITCDPCPNCPQ